jgi:hypothetical protein
MGAGEERAQQDAERKAGPDLEALTETGTMLLAFVLEITAIGLTDEDATASRKVARLILNGTEPRSSC